MNPIKAALNIALIALIFIINLGLARPALADRAPIDQNPDYIAITESLANLTQAQASNTLPEGMSTADVQQQLTALQYQKYIMETGTDTICRNDTTQTIAVYGDLPKQSTATFAQVLYLLPAGEATDDDWSCKGVYLPNDAKVDGLTVNHAAALKILDGTQLVVTENPETGAIAFNLPPVALFSADEINWEIPDLTQAELNQQFPAAPLD